MRPLLAAVLLAPLAAAHAQAPATTTYSITLDYFGGHVYWRLDLTDTAGTLTGSLDGDIVNGHRTADHITFHAYDKNGGTEDLDGTLTGGRLTGTIVWLQDGDPPSKATRHSFTADAIPTRAPDPRPAHIEFTPTKFERQFGSDTPPVLHLWPGDILHTTTVDAGGFDEHNVHRSQGGNPQTGPFFIETAMPGDVLIVHINRLKLNRDTAISDDGIVPRGLTPRLANIGKDLGKDVTWHLDVANGVATSGLPGDHLKTYTVPLRPMLGCIATAPNGTRVAIPTGDSGPFGGNMDFNEITEGATVYLPVSVPGALLYLGDGHAAQGDGELNGNALETSLDVEISVDLFSKANDPNTPSLPAPRVENATHIIATGYEGSLDDAFRSATANMAQWLTTSYKLTPSEAAQLLGTAAEYKVTEVADRNAGIALKIPKARLATLTK